MPLTVDNAGKNTSYQEAQQIWASKLVNSGKTYLWRRENSRDGFCEEERVLPVGTYVTVVGELAMPEAGHEAATSLRSVDKKGRAFHIRPHPCASVQYGCNQASASIICCSMQCGVASPAGTSPADVDSAISNEASILLVVLAWTLIAADHEALSAQHRQLLAPKAVHVVQISVMHMGTRLPCPASHSRAAYQPEQA